MQKEKCAAEKIMTKIKNLVGLFFRVADIESETPIGHKVSFL
jgi:hypothetical protein